MLGIFEEMDHFTPRMLITEDHVPTANLCNFYNLSPQTVQTELGVSTRNRAVQDVMPLNDLIPDYGKLELIHLDDEGTGSDGDDDE